MQFIARTVTAALLGTLFATVAFSQNPSRYHRLDLEESGKEVKAKILSVSSGGDFAEFERKTKDGTKKFNLYLKSYNSDSSLNTRKPHLNQLTLESQQLVERLIEKIGDRKKDQLSRDIRDSIWAEERLKLYKEKLAMVPANQKNERQEVQAKIETLEKLVEQKAIVFGATKQYLPVTELEAERQRADSIVNDWLLSKDRKDKQRLQKLIQENPLCLEAHLLLSLLMGAGDSDFNQAEKRLQRACEIADRYFVSNQDLSNDTDLDNYVRLLNNHAVFQIRQNNFRVAMRDWEKVAELNRPLPPALSHNVAKLHRMAKGKQGLSLGDTETKKLYEFAGSIGATSGRKGGWQLMPPVDLQKNQRDVGFLIGGKVKMLGNVISDTRCLLCNGSGAENCKNTYFSKSDGKDVKCRNGSFRIGVYRVIKDRNTGLQARFRTHSTGVKCRNCVGGKARCHTCGGSGAQDN